MNGSASRSKRAPRASCVSLATSTGSWSMSLTSVIDDKPTGGHWSGRVASTDTSVEVDQLTSVSTGSAGGLFPGLLSRAAIDPARDRVDDGVQRLVRGGGSPLGDLERVIGVRNAHQALLQRELRRAAERVPLALHHQG